MNECIFIINDVIKNVTDNTLYRILWIDPKCKNCYTIKLSTNRFELEYQNIDFIRDDFVDGILVLSKDEMIKSIIIEDISEKQRFIRDKAYKVIEKIVSPENEPLCFRSKVRGKLIKDAMDTSKVSKATVYKYLRRYWQGGKIKNSLLPNYNVCGTGRAELDVKNYKKLGRPNNLSIVEGKSLGVNIDEETKKIFKLAIVRYYLKPKERSLDNVYHLMIKDFYTETRKTETGEERRVRKSNEIPTIGQFKYWFNKKRDLDNEVKKIFGEKKYMLNNRAILSDSIIETSGPGFRYQVDATIGDVYLINSIDRKSIIGRPVVYIAVDVFSRLITGVHVCLEGPSWNGISSLLYNCFEDKVEYCKRYGIDIDTSAWNVKGIPRNIIADRGELVGPIAEPIIEGLGISIENTGSYRGDAKGLVEQYFHVINTKILHWTPGEVKKEYRERGERDYRLDAVLDLHEFTKIVILAVMNKNISYNERYPLSQEMINSGIRPIPNEIWNWGLENKNGNLTVLPDDLIRANLMRKGSARVTKKGIIFQRLPYTCERALNEGWFSKARIKGTWSIDISFDNRDLSNIYIIDRKNNDLILCTLVEESSLNQIYFGKTYEEVLDYQFVSRLNVNSFDDEKKQNQYKFDISIEEVIEGSVKLKSSSKNITLNIRGNRKLANVTIRKGQALSTKVKLEKGFNSKLEIKPINTQNESNPKSNYLNLINSWKEKEVEE